MKETVPPATVWQADLDALTRRARGLIGEGKRAVLGITGSPGAGKSTVCTALERALAGQAVVVGMDGFHLANEVLESLGRRGRKGAPDTFDVAGYAALLQRIAARQELVYAPRFDRGLEEAIAGAIPVPPQVPLIITEGNYLLLDGWEAARATMDEVWFLDVPSNRRRGWLVDRRMGFGDMRSDAEDWVQRVDEPNARLVTATRDRADVVVQVTGDLR